MTKDDERTRAQLPDYVKRRMDDSADHRPLAEKSADVFVGSYATKDTSAARIRTPILINDSSNEDSTISGSTPPLHPDSDDNWTAPGHE